MMLSAPPLLVVPRWDLNMVLDGFWSRRWDQVVSNWQVIWGAKAVFGSASLLLVAGTALISWYITAALHVAEIAGLNATIKADEATIKFQDVQLKGVVANVATPAPPIPKDTDIDYSNLGSLSPSALTTATNYLTKNLREIETTYRNEENTLILAPYSRNVSKETAENEWANMIRQVNKLQSDENYEWQTKYRGRVFAIYGELCKRLGILPFSFNNAPPTSKEAEAASVLRTGGLAGPYPISGLADYLEELARELR